MIYLDTHVVVWFYAQDRSRFPQPVQDLMNRHEWYISPMVRLELQYLYEIGRINSPVETIMSELSRIVGLAVCPKAFDTIVAKAMGVAWTRDPFDRIIVAHAGLDNDLLITADQTMHSHYSHAFWQKT